jgi:hypothetical protein
VQFAGYGGELLNPERIVDDKKGGESRLSYLASAGAPLNLSFI